MRDAFAQAWPPFLMVAALIALGAVAAREGVFAWAAGRLEPFAARSPRRLLAASLLLVAATTAVLNLDVAVVFCTPTLVLLARRAGHDEAPVLLGTVLMANGASLLLPGANLTNVLVAESTGEPASAMLGEVAPAGAAAALATGLALLLLLRPQHTTGAAPPGPPPPLTAAGRRTVVLALVAAALVVVLRDPAPYVAALALVAVLAARSGRAALHAVGPRSLLALLALAVLAGTLARAWDAPGDAVGQATGPAATALAALLAATLNNLPATLLVTPAPPADPASLLLGLDLGPNLLATGSLATLLWWRSAQAIGARPSLRAFHRVGPPAALAGLAAGVLAAGLT